ncbi:MAG: IS1595 family transposase [Proteobacteria bacterium]|nr:IS1595 family transposase [Pseudomonadota bacterium]MBU1234607.1 IS1595 family transposase [Pseudomonadota bacterium]MBU1416980.1 IS1595 family transposase [Pseudomonadota bacterium]MBU1454691.1 IS1595 family transposase [Pseudomonadota bacterium]
MQAILAPKNRFPKTIEEFRKEFHSETTSLHFLFNKRWPNGFVCPYCNWRKKEQEPTKTITCGHCGHPTSITTNTIMHGTKKALIEWLSCIWWLASTDGGHSAKDLQRLLNLSSYQTAWTWLQKLRMAMAVADNKPCRGTVELWSDSILLGGHMGHKEKILAAAEIILPSGITGRIKMEAISDLSSNSVTHFLVKHVAAGSSLVVPDSLAYHVRDQDAYLTVTDAKSATAVRIQQIIKSFEIWLNKIHRGGVVAKHLQLYLDEFCFRSNVAMLSDNEAIFHLLLSAVLSQKSRSYRNITANTTTE